MDVDLFLRAPLASAGGSASESLTQFQEIARLETTIEADDGQQYKIILLDADDTFDLVVHYPNAQREIVWSLVRERERE